MRVMKRVFLFGVLLVLALLAGIGGLAIYVFTHPETLRGKVETALSGALDAECSLETLALERRPYKRCLDRVARHPA